MITNSENIISTLRENCAPDAKIVFVSGNFNIIHPGHIRIINFAATCGDILVVGVFRDGVGNTLVNQDLRLAGVNALAAVNYSFILEETVEQFLYKLKPNIVVKGEEYRRKDNVEQKVLESFGGRLIFDSGDSTFSFYDFLRDSSSNSRRRKLPEDYMLRHSFSFHDLEETLRKFSSKNVVVVGDLIVDEYIDCEPLGMSREDPTIVVSPINSKRFIGGASIVAAHIAGLGANVKYFSVSGNDELSAYAKEELISHNVKAYLYSLPENRTILKQRFRAENKTLLRVNHLHKYIMDNQFMLEFSRKIEEELHGCDLVIFSDFNYGCLQQFLIDKIIKYCREKNIFIVADCQSSSQIGNICRYSGVNLIAPTEYEARIALHDNVSGLVILAENLKQVTQTEHVIITLGSEGILIHSQAAKNNISDDRLPAFNPEPIDVSGAGDCFLAATSLSLISGSNIWKSSFIGSIASSCQVGRIGNRPIELSEILSRIH